MISATVNCSMSEPGLILLYHSRLTKSTDHNFPFYALD